ncbi:MAG: SelB C-terminal domain-containing protein, partial [Planctomycetota bacterium]|nr:SelB C-terminal domain-containing protein [Planctomycetota bacterium]
IDRVFTIDGHGTIVTGSVMSGDVHAGDTLTLLPDDRPVRVRSVQNHGSRSEGSGARQRTAVNLAGMKVDELSRGRELVTPGFVRSSSRLLVELRSLHSSPIVIKDRVELSLHLATSEVTARVVLKGRQLKPGERAVAELRTKEPVVGAYGQRFILRRISPALTVAGGTILDPLIEPEKRIRDLQEYGKAMSNPSESARLSFLLSQSDAPNIKAPEAVWRAGVSEHRFDDVVRELTASNQLVKVANGIVIQAARLESLSNSILRTIREELARRQPRRSLPRDVIHSVCRNITKPDLIDGVIDRLLTTKLLVLVGKNLGPADAQVKLSKNQQQQRVRMLDLISAAGLSPPSVKELTTALGQKLDQVAPLVTICVEDGLLVSVSDALYYSPEALDRGRTLCGELLDELGEATMSQLREKWGVSRKFAVPLCEFFDDQGVTVRRGDVRVPGPRIGQSFAE